MIRVGKILKSRGIKGEVKVLVELDDPNAFANIPYIYIDGDKYHIAALSTMGGFVYMSLDEVGSRNESDLLRNKEIFIEDRFLPPLKKGRYFVSDLIGLKLVADGQIIGTITDVNNYGAGDVISFTGERDGMFPYLNKVVLNVDIEGGEMLISAEELLKVCCYAD